jgi:hypothetical protein
MAARSAWFSFEGISPPSAILFAHVALHVAPICRECRGIVENSGEFCATGATCFSGLNRN